LFLSNLAFADSAVVDCSGATPGAFTSIHAALAALLSGVYKPHAGERVGVVLCGANADLAKFPA
ncbi:MAG TPA: threonine/serine dehydratase, partial [Candidatus Angelobacter sp.]|nr:threonine/serine dehydratase [Candidatus Angelobacter sp.]